MQTVRSGSVETDAGVFVYDTISCKDLQIALASTADFCRLSGRTTLDADAPTSWYLIHHIPKADIISSQLAMGKSLAVILLILTVLLMPLAWVITQFVFRQRMRHEQLKTRAFVDVVTGLANRNQFMDQLEVTFQMARRFGDPFAIIFIDLDGFKQINDAHGHDAGDALLKEVGQRLERSLRAIDLVARLGGDEFTILLPKVSQRTQATVIADKIVMALSQPLWFGSGTAIVTGSVGIAFYDTEIENSTKLLDRADTAMYAAKLAGKNTSRFWEAGLEEHTSAYTDDDPKNT